MYNHKGFKLTPNQKTVSIPEAICLTQEAVASLKKGNFPLHAKAVQLGIEALKRLQDHKARYPNLPHFLLPGETPPKEGEE